MRWLRDRRAWKRAQRLHVYEHVTGTPVSLPCDAVGHWSLIDDYSDFFDADNRRKFCMAAGRDW